MKLRTTLWLMFWCLVLALCVQVTRRQDGGGATAAPPRRPLIDLTTRPVLGLTLLSTNGLVECRRQAAGAEWLLVRPIDYRADQDQVDRILGALDAAVVQERISSEQRQARGLRFADYGLARPVCRVVVDDGAGRRIIMVGSESPLGDQVYLRVAGEPDVVGVQRDLLRVLQPAVNDLRDRAVLRGVASSSMRAEIEHPQGGFVQLVRSGGRWMLQQPISARADSVKVDAMLDAAFALRVERYVWDPVGDDPAPAAPGRDAVVPPAASGGTVRDRVEPYGLGAGEAVRLAVWSLEPDSRQDLFLGKPTTENPEWVYARRGDSPAIFAVSRTARDGLGVTARDIRDRQVFPFAADQVRQVQFTRNDRRLTLLKRPDSGWTLTEPAQAKADDMTVQAAVADLLRWRVAEFLDVPQTNLAAHGLVPPAWSIQVSTRLPPPPTPAGAEPAGVSAVPVPEPVDAANPLLVTVAVSEAGPRSNLLYAVVQGISDVVALPAIVARHPVVQVDNALVLRDRTVLAVPTAQIQKVVRSAGDREESVLRDETGAWTRAGEADRQVDRAAVEALLFGVANLRAQRVEASAANDLSSYGLDQPALTITLRLTGEAGIQKTLAIGRPAEGEGAYAMVKGQDVVFILGAASVRTLSAALTVPAAASPAVSPPAGAETSGPAIKVSP